MKYTDKVIDSSLPIDQLDYPSIHEEYVSKLDLEADEASAILDLHENGYALVDLDEDSSLYDALDSEIEEIFTRRPRDLLCAGDFAEGGKLIPISETLSSESPSIRVPGSRLIDIHSHSEAARRLYLNPKIHRIVSAAINATCIATQSLYFEYGSKQPLHRDPWFVVTKPPQNLMACWIALEDIHIDSGPLSYIQGSHRWPFLWDASGNIVFHAPSATEEFRKAGYAHISERKSLLGSKVRSFTAKKGQVFIWHGGLVHGGSAVVNPELTRKSLVVHFDSLTDSKQRGTRYFKHGKEVVQYTRKKYKLLNSYGYINPMLDNQFDSELIPIGVEKRPNHSRLRGLWRKFRS